MTPKVTVLMTVYNGERHLRECMDSVLGQTFSDFEFLIIDDCGSDNSKDIINSYKDRRIRLIENDVNLGQVKSLNIGLDDARGEYIARMDQDDIIMKNRLDRQVDFLDRNKDISLVGAWGEVIDEKGKIFTRARLPLRNEEIIGTALFCGYFLMHPSVTFRKDVVMDAGKYDENITFSEDYDLWTRLMLKRRKLANMPEYLVRFRYHKKSSSRQFPQTQVNNVRVSIANFIKAIIGDYHGPDLDILREILINAGLMNKAFWSGDLDKTDLKKAVSLMDALLRKTISYFNFKGKEAHLLKKVFCKRMLNFAYQASGRGKKKSMPLYLFCLRNYMYLFMSPKLYLYPIRSAL